MKYFIFFYIVFVIGCHSRSQNINAGISVDSLKDSLKDYSCLLILTKKTEIKENYNVVGIATGFFIKNKGRLYLVSANHVFTGNDPIRVIRIDSTSPDLIAFHYDITGKKEKGFQNIYLDSIKKANPPKLITKSPDILAYKIELPEGAKIKTIENFINEDLVLSENDSLFFWGFPANQKDLNESIRFYALNPTPVRYDGVFIKTIDSLNFMATPNTNSGSSGAPVFVKRQINGIEKVFLIGILSAGSDVDNLSFIVTYKELIKMINQDY